MGDAQIAENMRHIVRFEAKPFPKHLPLTAVTRGFERTAFPKIVRDNAQRFSELVQRSKH